MPGSRRPTLLPADPTPSTTPSDRTSTFATRSIMKRHMTTNACVGCRKKRAKCDGRSPCSRCIARHEPCDYKTKTSITKDDLRAEVEMLRAERLKSRAVLNALLLDKHEAIIHRLRSGESVDVIARSLTADEAEDDGQNNEDTRQDQPSQLFSPSSSSDHASPSAASDAIGAADRGTSVIDIPKQFKTGRLDPTISATGGDFQLPGWLLTPVESPTTPRYPSATRPDIARRHSFDDNSLTEHFSGLGSRMWTKVTPDRALMKHLLGLFFSWEFPPFTMVSEELFLRDYFQGGRQFCSPALVNAIACVATRYLEPDGATSSGDAHLLGEQFFSEAKGLLVYEAQLPNLPSIQTFALLAVREMSCGRELEAQELCLQAVRLLSALNLEDFQEQGQLTDYLTVRSITFAGVISLTRAIRLITDQLSPASNYYYYTDMPLVLNLVDRDGESLAAQFEQQITDLRSKLYRDPKPKAADMLSSFIFDQTEYVYSFLSQVGRSGNPKMTEPLPVVYKTCLQSYETITDFLKEQGDSSPCTLFAHIYFHFCLLALFRPFVLYGVDVAGISPRNVCAEAVNAILGVTQSYASLFTLRRTPCFVPYFVFAAGLTRILLKRDPTAENSSSPSSGVGSSPATAKTETGSPYQLGELDDGGDTPMAGADSQNSMSPTSAIDSSAITWSTSATMTNAVSEEDRGLSQAVLQLQEMSVGHPAAAQAGWVLRDVNPRHNDSR
ncbi:hypothetical protein CONLIGDRAFT_279533 [Coniochaeta ligniaria NRRL 30616]|uniref:Zn(2)-C6 fungal-type domain-containing protein n=1 Tax=Coniochaeta ligniaria NRRL 30616 TaxID=1408157 RepID=A0A1J7ITE8_9PEZI|nr:hypothetical protein CONLIGDRAFT_279533 [Coniochaeta ligniaria NRRL 30616]